MSKSIEQFNRNSKIISYRGGIVTFEIPSHWHEEYEASGGAMFYEDRPDSGTLRLNALSFEFEDTPSDQLASHAFPSDSFELLPTGLPIRYSVSDVEEDEELLRIHKWEVAVPIPSNKIRMVIFQHTVLANLESDQAILSEIAFLQESIRSAQFSKESSVAGDYSS